MHIRRKLQQIRNRIVGNFGWRLLGQCRRAQQYEQPDKPAFHGDLPWTVSRRRLCARARPRPGRAPTPSIQISALATQSAPRARRQQEIEDMRYIDAFNHFFPKRIYELMLQSPAGQKDLGKRMRGIPALYDVEERLRVVDSFPDYTQVICLGMPAIDRLTGPDQ